MSIPMLEHTNLNSKISELQMEYAYITFYDTFVNSSKLVFITFILEIIVFIFLMSFAEPQIFICVLALIFMALVQAGINHIVLVPLMTLFPKQLLNADQITWSTQFR